MSRSSAVGSSDVLGQPGSCRRQRQLATGSALYHLRPSGSDLAGHGLACWRSSERPFYHLSLVRDPWAVLGVDSSVDYETARSAYLVRSQLLHPDRHQGASAAVLAEANRSQEELNAAWQAVKQQLMKPGAAREKRQTPGAPRDDKRQRAQARPASGKDRARQDNPASAQSRDDVLTDAEACLDWVIGSIIAAGRAQGDPIAPFETSYMMLPIRKAGSSRRLEQWLDRRVLTLRLALDADERSGEGRRDWDRAYKMIDQSGKAPVLMLLLDRVL